MSLLRKLLVVLCSFLEFGSMFIYFTVYYIEHAMLVRQEDYSKMKSVILCSCITSGIITILSLLNSVMYMRRFLKYLKYTWRTDGAMHSDIRNFNKTYLGCYMFCFSVSFVCLCCAAISCVMFLVLYFCEHECLIDPRRIFENWGFYFHLMFAGLYFISIPMFIEKISMLCR